ncbi:MAG: C40 family peptidase [Alphaproteobacteria bacterium]
MADLRQIYVPSVFVRQSPDEHAEVSNQLLFGESVRVIDDRAPIWIEIESAHDSYQGFIPKAAICEAFTPSHKISVPLTHVYEQPDFKSAILWPLFFHSPVRSSGQTENGFFKLDHGGWIYESHLVAMDSTEPDFVKTALMFEGAPYVWGGRSVSGVDCSGLVQISLMAAGVNTPRDTHQQDQSVGAPIPEASPALMRGDLVFFKGHVGIMLDEQRVLNATSRHMQVVVENIEDLAKAYGGITCVRRMDLDATSNG